MSRRKRQLEQFDVAEFLRESDDDLKSALHSLLNSAPSPNEARESPNPGPGPNLIPDPPQESLQRVLPRLEHDEVPFNMEPGIKMDPGINIGALSNLGAGPELIATNIALQQADTTSSSTNLDPGIDLKVPGPCQQDPPPPTTSWSAPTTLTNTRPGINLSAGFNLAPPSQLFYEECASSDENLPYPLQTSITNPPPKRRQFPIREMKLAQEAHTRAEQQVYEYLWQNAEPLDDVSRTITIGFGTMARVVRLSESNTRINVRNLIAKLAMEECGEYNCERSIGRTYRIFTYSEILKRRRGAGLIWYMRRTLAVIFVEPKSGKPVDLGLKKRTTQSQDPVLI